MPAVQCFLSEFGALVPLQHANLVTSYAAYADNKTLFIVREYVDGIDLDQLVRRVGCLSIGRACDYIRQAAVGLAHAHQWRVLHRDIKPNNLLLAYADSAVKVLGLAGLDVGMIGTPMCSPEQSLGLWNADCRSDLYSLGYTFYFLLTGQVPFPEGTFAEKSLKHHMGQPTPLEKFRSDVPAEIVAVVNKLMAKRPEDRYQTADEVAEALEPFAALESSAERYRIRNG